MDLWGNRSELLSLQSEVLICLGRTCIDNLSLFCDCDLPDHTENTKDLTIAEELRH